MSIVIFAILLLVFGLPLVRLIFLLAANAHADKHVELRRLCGNNLPSAMLSAYWTSVGSTGLAPILYPTGIGKEPMPLDSGTPILLLHGLYHNRSAWTVFRRRLYQAGHNNVRAFSYGSWKGDLGDALTVIREELRQTMKANPGRKVFLVGHSLGGVLWRLVASEEEFRDHVAGLVTLGSPFGGSVLAHLGVGKVARSLIPGREACRRLETAKDTDAPKMAVVSPVDDFVFPVGCLEPGDGWYRYDCPPVSHVWLLYSEDVADTVIRFLDEYV